MIIVEGVWVRWDPEVEVEPVAVEEGQRSFANVPGPRGHGLYPNGEEPIHIQAGLLIGPIFLISIFFGSYSNSLLSIHRDPRGER